MSATSVPSRPTTSTLLSLSCPRRSDVRTFRPSNVQTIPDSVSTPRRLPLLPISVPSPNSVLRCACSPTNQSHFHLVVPLNRYVAATYPLCLPLLRKLPVCTQNSHSGTRRCSNARTFRSSPQHNCGTEVPGRAPVRFAPHSCFKSFSCNTYGSPRQVLQTKDLRPS